MQLEAVWSLDHKNAMSKWDKPLGAKISSGTHLVG